MTHNNRQRPEQTDVDEKPAPQRGTQPFSLTPMQLNPEPMREITAREIRSVDQPATSFTEATPADARPGARLIKERRVIESAVQLRPEIERAVPMRDVPVTEVAMRELGQRRIDAMPLDIVVPGIRVRAEEDA